MAKQSKVEKIEKYVASALGVSERAILASEKAHSEALAAAAEIEEKRKEAAAQLAQIEKGLTEASTAGEAIAAAVVTAQGHVDEVLAAALVPIDAERARLVKEAADGKAELAKLAKEAQEAVVSAAERLRAALAANPGVEGLRGVLARLDGAKAALAAAVETCKAAHGTVIDAHNRLDDLRTLARAEGAVPPVATGAPVEVLAKGASELAEEDPLLKVEAQVLPAPEPAAASAPLPEPLPVPEPNAMPPAPPEAASGE